MMRWVNIQTGYQDRITALRAKAPHEVLGILENSSPAVVRAAYLSLVRAYHPDCADPFVAKHGEEVVKIVNDAYRTMLKRARK